MTDRPRPHLPKRVVWEPQAHNCCIESELRRYCGRSSSQRRGPGAQYKAVTTCHSGSARLGPRAHHRACVHEDQSKNQGHARHAVYADCCLTACNSAAPHIMVGAHGEAHGRPPPESAASAAIACYAAASLATQSGPTPARIDDGQRRLVGDTEQVLIASDEHVCRAGDC